MEWLRNAGGEQFIFKYCSTFDSTHAATLDLLSDSAGEALSCDTHFFTLLTA
ncbi:hypothetical protein [Paraburkholderia sp.]|uniref:hypothetical protein n=1 Tax=Paraburkholderia sp. TaxID=1926495 RepID=UPI003C7EA905